MPTSIQIPEKDRDLIKKWLVDGEAPAEKILVALGEVTPALLRTNLSASVARVSGEAKEVVDQVLRIFINVTASVRLKEDQTTAIAEMYRAVAGESDVDKLKEFEARVRKLTALPSIVVTAKAFKVMTSNDKSFCSARTLSEIRPVFMDEKGLPMDEPHTAVILHQLNIVFHRGPNLDKEEVFVTLDSEDLHTLKAVVDRAIAKDIATKRLLRDNVKLLTEDDK